MMATLPSDGPAGFVPAFQATAGSPSTHCSPQLEGSLDEFSQLSANFLLDPQYCEMDRIISFQDSYMR